MTHRSASVRRINRRAALILTACALVLAGLLQLVADHGLVVFGVLIYPALIVAVGVVSGLGAYCLGGRGRTNR